MIKSALSFVKPELQLMIICIIDQSIQYFYDFFIVV